MLCIYYISLAFTTFKTQFYHKIGLDEYRRYVTRRRVPSSSSTALKTNNTLAQVKPAWKPLDGADWSVNGAPSPFSENCHLFGRKIPCALCLCLI